MVSSPAFVLRWLAWLAFFAAASLTVPARAVDQAGLYQTASLLKPGESAWDEVQSDAPVSIVISIVEQRLYVYRGGVLIGVSAVSTGKPGKETPEGRFPILQKAKWHRSNLYSNAPMPFMQRLTWDGIALHAGYNPGYPASHGCIRLPTSFARRLFEMTSLGAMVTVTGLPHAPPLYLRFEDLEWASADDLVTGGAARAAPVRLARADTPVLDYALGVFTRE